MTTLDPFAPLRAGLPLIPSGFSLESKYTQAEGLIYLTGIQALVRLPLDQLRADARRGLRTAAFIAGYRGSPLGGFDMELERARRLLDEHHIVHSPGLNEELAATAVMGSQTTGEYPGARYDGVLGIWYGKGPGVDRTGDVFRHGNVAGTSRHGGVLALGGDDPSSKSSTMPSASEVAFYDALMPTLYPGGVQDILDLGRHGVALSRAAGLWVAMKIVTNVADGAGTAEVSPDRIQPIIPTVEWNGRPYEHRLDWRLAPPTNLEMERTLHEVRLEIARRYAAENGLNLVTVPTRDAWLGIIAAGKTYNDLRQALDELGLDEDVLERHGIRLLKIGMLFPMEPGIVRDFARGLHEVLVVEEKRPFLETFLKDALYSLPDRPVVTGKHDDEGHPLVPAWSELDPDLIARAVAARVRRRLDVPSVAARIAYLDAAKHRPAPLTVLPRTAFYCSGCPHNTGTTVPEGHIVGAGIGCHSMAIWMDPERYGQIIGITQMGGEGAQWVGIAPFTETPHIFQNIGDGTLFHSGQLAINYAVASGVNITYKVLYNAAVAMTGGQTATGQLPIPALVRRLEAEGVKRIIITTDDADKYRGVQLAPIAEVWHRDRILEAQEELAQVKGVTVLIHDQQCAAEKRRLRKRGRLAEPAVRLWINERVCEGCGDCGRKSNCLSVQPIDTEFGRKTQVHQPSCNKDYSCLRGDCPSFVSIEPATNGSGQPRRASAPRSPLPAPSPSALPEPRMRVPSDQYALHMMGIGGTGVVTVNQVLGTASLLEGKHVWGLDQTGLSQKGGPVVSDLKLYTAPSAASSAPRSPLPAPDSRPPSKVTAGGADLYLGFDLLVAADPHNLTRADPGRTIAVISTSQVPTGRMVTDSATRFPALSDLLSVIDAGTRKEGNVYLDAQAMSLALFGDHMPANILLLGAAYQAGAVPVAAAAIEQAIRLNGAAVEANLAAFRWGRLAVHDPAYIEVALSKAEAAPSTQHTDRPGLRPTGQRNTHPPVAQRLLDASVTEGELRRLLEVRVPDLIAYQNVAYARQYVDFVRRVAQAEQQQTPGRTALAEAVARYLYKLMAYKDEYEVARLHLDTAATAAIESGFGPDARLSWNLHPPMLRALGLRHKVKLGPWFTPAMKALRDLKRLRGTPLDPFGHAQVRKVERALIPEYRAMIEATLAKLTPETHGDAVKLAELPDMVRGYEQIKLENVKLYRQQARELIAKLKEHHR